MDEAHVEHAVGFVEHEHLHMSQRHGLLFSEIEQAAGCGDDDVAAVTQLRDLRAFTHATEDRHDAQARVLAVMAHAFFDLRGEFARGSEDQRARSNRIACSQLLQDRKHEACRLAGAGLCAREYIAAAEHGGNRRELDGGGNRVTLFGHGSSQLGLEPEVGKIHEYP